MDANIDTGGVLENYISDCSQCNATLNEEFTETVFDCIDNGFTEEVRNVDSKK